MAMAWVARIDYEHAGFKMLPKNAPHGYKASLWIVAPLLILFPTVYKLYVMNLAGWLYLAGALLVTLGFFYYGIRFSLSRTVTNARSLMFASFAYLPLVDRKSTRLNSSHVAISYAVFCLKKKR